MKSIYVGTLVPNDTVTAYFLVLSKEVRQKKTGEPYLSLHLADRTGEIEAKMWDNVEEVLDTFERDSFVKVKGIMQPYNNRSQFVIHKLRRLQDEEVDFEDFFPCSDRDGSEMWQELRGVIDGIGNEHLRQLLNEIFADERIAAAFQVAPAAKNIHHACRGGLLEHVLSLCTLCKLVGPHYKDIDLDLLLTGAILHDIGKVEELSYERSFNYTPDGQLLGHIVIGLRVIADKIGRVPDFPHKLRTLLEHLIISHHGELEFGSPKTPLFAEAMLLHHLDNMDSKMEAIRQVLKREAASENEFTGWVASLERTLLRKEQYLGGKPKTDPPPAPAEDFPAVVVETPASKHVEVTPAPPRPARPVANNLFGDKLQAALTRPK